jgi:hypothetical protein
VYGEAAVMAVLIGTALSGFTAMLYEVTWIRLLSIIIRRVIEINECVIFLIAQAT